MQPAMIDCTLCLIVIILIISSYSLTYWPREFHVHCHPCKEEDRSHYQNHMKHVHQIHYARCRCHCKIYTFMIMTIKLLSYRVNMSYPIIYSTIMNMFSSYVALDSRRKMLLYGIIMITLYEGKYTDIRYFTPLTYQ